MDRLGSRRLESGWSRQSVRHLERTAARGESGRTESGRSTSERTRNSGARPSHRGPPFFLSCSQGKRGVISYREANPSWDSTAVSLALCHFIPWSRPAAGGRQGVRGRFPVGGPCDVVLPCGRAAHPGRGSVTGRVGTSGSRPSKRWTTASCWREFRRAWSWPRPSAPWTWDRRVPSAMALDEFNNVIPVYLWRWYLNDEPSTACGESSCTFLNPGPGDSVVKARPRGSDIVGAGAIHTTTNPAVLTSIVSRRPRHLSLGILSRSRPPGRTSSFSVKRPPRQGFLSVQEPTVRGSYAPSVAHPGRRVAFPVRAG